MGAPSISGGMTAEEQRKLLAEERQFQAEQEEKRRQIALEDERRREEQAQAERDRIAREEAERIAEIQKAEQAVIDEASAMEEEGKKGKKERLQKVSFYEALGKGVVNKPSSAVSRSQNTQ